MNQDDLGHNAAFRFHSLIARRAIPLVVFRFPSLGPTRTARADSHDRGSHDEQDTATNPKKSTQQTKTCTNTANNPARPEKVAVAMIMVVAIVVTVAMGVAMAVKLNKAATIH